MSVPLRRAVGHLAPPIAPSSEVERLWVQSIAAGDESAFQAMFRAYNRELHRFALGQLRCPDDAEDVVQAVFVSIWQRRAHWRVTGSLRAYLFSAVRKRTSQQLRNARRHLTLASEVVRFTAARPSRPLLGPDRHAEEQEFSAALAGAVDALAPRCREAFLLTRAHGMTYAEAAATMGISPRTVMVQIGRALASLRKSLAPFLPVLLSILASNR